MRKARSLPEGAGLRAFGTRLPNQDQWQLVCERPTLRTVERRPFNGRRPRCPGLVLSVARKGPDTVTELHLAQPWIGLGQAVAYAVRHPERVSHLILYGGYARGWALRGNADESARREGLGALIRHGWGQDNPAFRQVFTTLFLPEASQEQMRWFNDLQRMTATPENAYYLHEAFGHLDVRPLLPEVQAPTLVLHCRHDSVVPFEEGRLFATHIPGARFVPLEGRNHILLESEPAWPRFLAEVRAFLATETP